MKKLFLIQIAVGLLSVTCGGQVLTAREKADDLAKNVFSKTKDKKKEKNGVITETHVKIESTPVVKEDFHDYAGNYWYKDLDYRLEVRVDAANKLMATLIIPGQPDQVLKNVSVDDAYFSATRSSNGKEEIWEGVFINRNNNGTNEFGLGIKPANPLPLSATLDIPNLFFKKVSP